MQSQAFAAAVRPALRRILRCNLRDYTIGHEIILISENNPLLWVPEYFDTLPLNTRANAVQRAVSICSRNWSENQSPDKNQWLWFWLIRKCDRIDACKEFVSYRATGSTIPQMKPSNSSESDAQGSPFVARLLDYGSLRFGERVYDVPLGQLQWMYFANAESDGRCKVKNSIQLQIDSEMKQHEEDYDREQKEKQCQP